MEQASGHELINRTLQTKSNHFNAFLAVPWSLFSVNPFHNQYPLTRQCRADIGDHDVVPILSVEISKTQTVVGFSFVIELSKKLYTELVCDSEDIPASHFAQPSGCSP